jgi:hypothetical protein
LKIKLLWSFKNTPDLKGLEMWLSKYLRDEILEYVGKWFRELKELLEFVFKTDFSNWSMLLGEENRRKKELEIITQALGEEIEELRNKANILIEKNARRIDFETINSNLEGSLARVTE